MWPMPGALRESIVGPPPGASTDPPTWVLPQDLAGCVPCDTSINLADICAAVTEWLFELSGKQYKQRRVVVRPTPRVGQTFGWWCGYTGDWQITPASFEAYACEATEPGVYDLRLSGPVQQIVAVKVDGVLLDPGDYALFDARYLVRVDPAGGRLSWPQAQRLDLPDTEAGTFSVNYVWGKAIPKGGHLAAQAWACYLGNQFNALAGNGDCALPSKVTQLVRQGTTLTRLSALDFIKEGKTGVDVVDAWLNVVNPGGNRRSATIASPDNMRGIRVE